MSRHPNDATNDDTVKEAARLINRSLDDVITSDEEQRLSDLMVQHPELVDVYLRLTEVHGQLLWGAGDAVRPFVPRDQTVPSRITSRRRVAIAVTCFSVIIAAALLAWTNRPSDVPVATDDRSSKNEQPAGRTETSTNSSMDSDRSLTPLQFDSLDQNTVANEEPPLPPDPGDVRPADRPSLSDAEIIAAINRGISAVQSDNGLEPSPRATDGEWVRRAYLTIAGRIPTPSESRRFSEQPDAVRRSDLIVDLVARGDRNLHLAEFWTNLLVGRSQRPHVNRDALAHFLAESFADNRSWIAVVGDLISAEGRNDENGATNFLLAHLDNQATPATAVTARLFLGEQLQCVQCHNHPFAGGIEQRDYWALNAFFQHTRRAFVPSDMDGATRPVSLVDRQSDGTVRTSMTYYETLKGRQEAALPGFDGHTMAVDDTRNRRQALARLLEEDSQHRVARAMVNRTWAQFFGYGFTSPVDDMGPHVPVSHPHVLSTLTDAFVASGYDLRRLQTWIALSDAWQRTSRPTATNVSDDPASGGIPLFTRVYMRRMSPEQMYDSIRVAIRGAAGEELPAELQTPHRREWVRQFVYAYETDENDEATQFDGSIAQAMVMMNGTDVNQAIGEASRSLLSGADGSSSPHDALERMSLATLTRPPTQRESAAFRRRLTRLSRSMGRQQAVPTVVEDMMWAYLNSSEFTVIH